MSNLPESVSRDLVALCTLLEDELERQHSVLGNVKAQGLAARAQDLPELDKRTAALSMLMRESLRSEQDRLRLLRPVVEYFELKGADQTLSNLIAAVPDPWKVRLSQFQAGLKKVIAVSRNEIQRNAGLMRTTVRRIDSTLEQVFQDGSDARQYTAGGSDARRERAAKMLDAMG